MLIKISNINIRRSQWPRGLRRGSAAVRLLKSWVRIPPGAWMFFCCECRVLSGRGLCVELITRPEKSYRLWCVVMCDLETSRKKRPWPTGGCRAKNRTEIFCLHRESNILSLLTVKYRRQWWNESVFGIREKYSQNFGKETSWVTNFEAQKKMWG